MGATPSQRVYTFTSKGNNFELVYDRSEQDANQKLSIYLTVDGIRYRYTTPTSSTQDNFANVIEHYGIWIRKAKRRPTAFSPEKRAVLFPGRIDDYQTAKALWKEPSPSGWTMWAMSKRSLKQRRSGNLSVFQDAKNTLASRFPFAHENDLVFMRERERILSRASSF